MRIKYQIIIFILFSFLLLRPFKVKSEDASSLGTAIPCGKDAVTYKDFRNSLRLWWEKQIIEPFKQRNIDKLGKLDKELRFLEEYCRFKAGCIGSKGPEPLFQMGKSFIGEKQDSSDPMMDFDETKNKESVEGALLACMGDVMVNRRNIKNRSNAGTAHSILEKALEYLEVQKYPIPLRASTAVSLAKAAYNLNKKNWTQENNKAIQLVAELLSENYSATSADARAVHKLIFLGFYLKRINFFNQLQAYARKQKMSEKSWVFNMLNGHVASKKAWKARGSGWASSVGKDGWKIFKELQTKAGEFFRTAWEIYPECPEAPSRLIGIAMTGYTKHGEDKGFWFAQAVKAQMDYHSAYNKYFWALRPRWGGSHEAILDLGIQAYNTKRFDTEAPRYLLYALLNISEESYASNWRANFRSPQIKAYIDDIYTNMVLKAATRSRKNMMNLEYAFCKAWMGEYDAAKTLFEKSRTSISIHSLFFNKAKKMMRWRKVFSDELAAFTGKSGATARKWEDLVLAGKETEAKKFEEELLDPEKTDIHTRRYILDRVIMNQIRMRQTSSPIYATMLSQVIHKKKWDAALRMIRAGADVNERGPNRWTPLLYAALRNNPEVAEALLDNGAKVNPQKNSYMAPLHYALRMGSMKVAHVLIEKGADLQSVQPDGWTPLHLASRYSDFDTVKLLIEKGAKVNILTRKDWAPVHLAAHSQKNTYEKLKVLIEHNANPNALNNKKESPLHFTARNGDFESVKLLLENGVDTTIKNVKGQIAADLAKNDQIKKLLNDWKSNN